MTHTRRRFLAPPPALTAFGQSKPLDIAAVEILQLQGHRDTTRGIDQQYQVNPLFIYDELRPKPYADSPQPTTQNAPVSAYSLRIKPDGGPDGLYDPRDPVPTRGGAVCCNPRVFPWGPMDQRPVEQRPDVLVYTTAPLKQDT